MAPKPTHLCRKSCLPLYILCALCRIVTFSEQTIRPIKRVQNIYNLSYIILETKINFQTAVTFVLVELDTRFNV